MEQRKLNQNGLDLEYYLIIKKIKNINLWITGQGEIMVSTPKGIPKENLDQFVLKKANWIYEKRSKILKKMKKEEFFFEGKQIFYFGKEYFCSFDKSDRFSVSFAGNKIFISSPFSPNSMEMKTAYLQWMKKESKPVFDRLLKEEYKKVKKYNVAYPKMTIRNMKTRWGSCSYYKNKITLNLQLAKKPLDCIRQVILHELIHFIYPNHSREFYEFLTLLMPDWKKQKEKLENICFDQI